MGGGGGGCRLRGSVVRRLPAGPQQAADSHAAAPHRARRLAGEKGLAAAPRPGPGSLRVGLLDYLHLLDREAVEQGAKVALLE